MRKIKRNRMALLCSLAVLFSILSAVGAQAATQIYVTYVHITIDEPKAGEKPATTATLPATASTCIKKVEWIGEFDKNGCFKPSRQYAVNITVGIKDEIDRTFNIKKSEDVTVNGTRALITADNDPEGREIRCQQVFETEKMKSDKPIPISSAKDLEKMEDIPDGKYYLTKDITVPKNLRLFDGMGEVFTGVLDGKGHKLKNYTVKVNANKDEGGSYALFGTMSGATVKNLTLSNVKMDVTYVSKNGGVSVAALANRAGKCKFSSVKVSGKINVNYKSQNPSYVSIKDCGVAGLVNSITDGSMTKCTNSVDISLKCGDYYGFGSGYAAGGLADGGSAVYKNCKNTGDITVNPYRGFAGPDYSVARVGGVAGEGSVFANCTNSGKIKFTYNGDQARRGAPIRIGGVAGIGDATGSRNTGSVTASAKNVVNNDMCIGGVVGEGRKYTRSFTKCSNTGSISFTGEVKHGVSIGGVAGMITGMEKYSFNQNYNKGKVTAKLTGNGADVGGVLGSVIGDVLHNYNTGTVTLSGKTDNGAAIGGVIGADRGGSHGKVTANYNTGVIKAKVYAKGSIIGLCDESAPEAMQVMTTVKDNYYTTSLPNFGAGPSWEAKKPKGKKVAKITAGNCPKLSSKYWTYSSSKGRMILKGNKEK